MPSSNENETAKMDWQNGIDTIHDRMKYLLETGDQSDVEFLVGKELWDEESQTWIPKEEPQLIKAHKLVLAGWDVLAAQFRTNKSNGLENEPIRVIDITASVFKAMLNFLYTNDHSLINSDNFLEVYSAGFIYLKIHKNAVESEKANLLKENQRLEARVTKANERFRARRMPGV